MTKKESISYQRQISDIADGLLSILKSEIVQLMVEGL